MKPSCSALYRDPERERYSVTSRHTETETERVGMPEKVWGEWGRGKCVRTSLTTGTSLTTCKNFSKVSALVYILYKATVVQTFEIHFEILTSQCPSVP